MTIYLIQSGLNKTFGEVLQTFYFLDKTFLKIQDRSAIIFPSVLGA